ncbi:MAG: Ribosomal large subunit pseudouridine synthase A [Chlamydiae bacterium]|nr:Ribosomal large subunit pseudouridine synthase A [Chlamydiota bacterium]
MHIIYEDNHLFVVNKPSGFLTQPSGTDQENLQDAAKQWIRQKYHKKGNVFLEPVHRLDKAASGIVVFARTSKALSRLMGAIRNRQVKKTYHAWVEGMPPSQEGTLEHYLVHDNYKSRVVSKETSNAKQALLHYRILKREADRTLVEIDLETGRYHQIRSQFAEVGCPIVRDTKYGSRVSGKGQGICLHHFRMEIPHPISNKLLKFEGKGPGKGPRD